MYDEGYDTQRGLNASRVPQPQPGIQRYIPAARCTYTRLGTFDPAARLDSGPSSLGSTRHLAGHHNQPRTAYPFCDVDCDNLRIQELYESFLLKHLLEDPEVTRQVLAVHQKVFDALRARDPRAFDRHVRDWQPGSAFPSAQVGPVVRSGDLMKHLAIHALPDDVTEARDYFFNAVMHRVRGYRTNRKRGADAPTTQVGIANFDYQPLEVPGAKPWAHPGRTRCDTSVLRSTYQRAADQRDAVSACGISGSTNFWIWTALASGADLSPLEASTLILSAYLTLGTDGGHSLVEVLASATLAATLFRLSLVHQPDSALSGYVKASTFADSLHQATRRVNPIGTLAALHTAAWLGPVSTRQEEVLDTRAVARKVFAREYPAHTDTPTESPQDRAARVELEALFAHGRHHLPFARYADLLDAIPATAAPRSKVLSDIQLYKQRYC